MSSLTFKFCFIKKNNMLDENLKAQHLTCLNIAFRHFIIGLTFGDT